MIYLTKGQKLIDNPSLVVYDPTGYYNDGDSVICAGVTSPNDPVCRYEAKFIAYGGMVYSVANPDELMKQILELDPKSLFGKDSQQVAVDKVVSDIVPQESGELTQEATTKPVETTATTTPAVSQPEDTQTSTSTPQTNLPQGDLPATVPDTSTSTTTPEVIPPTSTSTPDVIPPISTSTPETILPEPASTSTPPLDIDMDEPVTDVEPTEPPTNTSSTTPVVVPAVIDMPEIIPPAPDNPVDNTSTSSEIVAFAKNVIKKKITRKLGL